MRAAMLAKVAAGLVVVVAAVVVVVLATMDFDAYRQEVADALRAATGREVAIEGAVRLDIGFNPSLVADRVRIANAPWGSWPQMLTADRIEVEVALLALLRGDVEVRRLVLVAPDILLETDAEGWRNWAFDDREPTTPKAEKEPGAMPTIGEFHLADGTLAYRDGATGKRYALTLETLSLETAADGGVNRFRAAGAFEGRRFAAQGNLGGLAGGGEEPRPFDVTVRVRGTAGLPTGAYQLAARVADRDGRWTLTEIRATAPGLELTSEAELRSGQEPPWIRARLAAPLVDLDVLAGGRPGTGDAPSGAGAPGDKAAAKRLLSDAPLPFEALAAVDARLDLAIDRLRAGGLEAGAARLRLRLIVRDGVLEVPEIKAELAGGTLSGRVRASAARSSVALDIRRVAVGRLAAALGAHGMFEAKGDLKLDLRGGGRSLRHIAAGLDGRVDLVLGKGKVFSRPLRLLGADLLQSLAPWASGKDDTALNCMVAHFAVAKGKARGQGLLLDTGTVTLSGEGTLDLGVETLDFRIVPRPKQARLLSIATPIKVTGTLAAPALAPDRLSVAKGVAGAVIGGLINPVGLLVPLISLGSDDKNPCVEALSRKPSRGRGGDGPANMDDDKFGIERTLEGVGRGIKGLLGK